MRNVTGAITHYISVTLVCKLIQQSGTFHVSNIKWWMNYRWQVPCSLESNINIAISLLWWPDSFWMISSLRNPTTSFTSPKMNWVHSGKTTWGDGMFKPGLLRFIRVDANRLSLGQVWDIKERFQLSEAFIRWVIELVFADLFHGSLGMGSTEHRLGRSWNGFPSAPITFRI